MRTIRNFFNSLSLLRHARRIATIIGRGMLHGLGILMTFALAFVGYLAYSAYTQLPTANSGDPLTSAKWNALVNMVNQHSTDITTLSGTVSNLPSTGLVTGWCQAGNAY